MEMLVAAVFFFYAFPLSDYLRHPQDFHEHTGVHLYLEADSGKVEALSGSHVS